MRLLSTWRYVGALMLCCARTSPAQQIDIDASATRSMYTILASLRNGTTEQVADSMLDSVLQTRPYRTMFRHYNRSWRPNHLPELVFKRMILSLQFPAEYSVGENQRADQMLPIWKYFYDHLSIYDANLRELDEKALGTLVRDEVRYAQTWLPPGWTVPAFYLPIIPSGGSRAFAVDTAEGYDFFQLPRDSSGTILWDELRSTIAHESHHKAIRTELPGPMSRSDSVSYEFLSLFLAEGTATKFVNAFPGGCVPSVDPARHDPAYSMPIRERWERYTTREADLFEHLTTTFERAHSGSLSRDSLHAEMGAYWLNGFVSPVYFVGAELFGAVYEGLGKEAAFAAMRDARELLPLYNDAVRKRPDLLSQCRLIPDSTVQHARAIGRSPN